MRQEYMTYALAGSLMLMMSNPLGWKRRSTYTYGRESSCSSSMSETCRNPPSGTCDSTFMFRLPRSPGLGYVVVPARGGNGPGLLEFCVLAAGSWAYNGAASREANTKLRTRRIYDLLECGVRISECGVEGSGSFRIPHSAFRTAS